jgi:hypothetical protein
VTIAGINAEAMRAQLPAELQRAPALLAPEQLRRKERFLDPLQFQNYLFLNSIPEVLNPFVCSYACLG